MLVYRFSRLTRVVDIGDDFNLNSPYFLIISKWVSTRYLTTNINKSKYMIITRKSSQFSSPLPSLKINDQLLEQVNSFI